MTTIGALFAGYGGLEMGVQSVLGGDLAWYSEIDKGALKILTHHHPDVPNVGDITAVDWATVPRVDILTGGSPCQDLSHAGKRAGMTDGTRSNLWVAMREAIAQLRPRLVVWENVRGAASAEATSDLEFCPGCMGEAWYRGTSLRALGRVVGDLADLGYVGGIHGLRAADVGAPHGRFRFILAATDADDGRRWEHHAGLGRVPVTDAHSLLPTPRASDGTKGGPNHRGSSGDLMLPSAVALLQTPSVSDSSGGHANRGGDRAAEQLLPGQARAMHGAQWGEYADAIHRWEHTLGRPAPAPTMTSSKGNPQLAPTFVEWMMGLPAGHVADVPDITRNEALKALGNGVVPQQAEAALRFLLDALEAAA